MRAFAVWRNEGRLGQPLPQNCALIKGQHESKIEVKLAGSNQPSCGPGR